MSFTQRLRNRLGIGATERVFASFAEASAACGMTYNDDTLARVVVEKTKALQANARSESFETDLGSLRTLAALGVLQRSPADGVLRVLDFGGAAGYHYLVARALLPQSLILDWRVVETPALVAAAQELQDGQMSLFSSIERATASWTEPPHLTFASGVLQCVPEPLKTCQELVDLSGDALVITRTSFSEDGTTRAIVQRSTLSTNGPGPLPAGFVDAELSYPTTFVPRKKVEEIITSRYTITAKVTEDPCSYRIHGTCIPTTGYFCRLR